MRRIFIFNPETDYALAVGDARYNPPAKILRMKKEMQLIQSHIAADGDAIAVSEDFDISAYPHPSHLKIVNEKTLSIVSFGALPSFIHDCQDKDPVSSQDICAPRNRMIQPWGWNHSLRKELMDGGVDSSLLPDPNEIETLRRLSHRRTVIPFQHILQKLLPDMQIHVAREFDSVSEAMDFAFSNDEVYFKAPWSSSGRGVVRSGSLSKEKLKEWIGGFIRKQGSVMGEQGFIRKADFATEWRCYEGKAEFIGYSLFNTNSEGRYLGNPQLSQEEINRIIDDLSSNRSEEIVEAQRRALDDIISPHYNGPIGVDMLADFEGRINPCVEINLRMTMGMINLGTQIL